MYHNIQFLTQTNHILPASKKGPSTSRVVKVQRCELAHGDKDRNSNIMNRSIIESYNCLSTIVIFSCIGNDEQV